MELCIHQCSALNECQILFTVTTLTQLNVSQNTHRYASLHQCLVLPTVTTELNRGSSLSTALSTEDWYKGQILPCVVQWEVFYCVLLG